MFQSTDIESTYHSQVLEEKRLQEFVLADLNQLHQVGVEGVAILLEKA